MSDILARQAAVEGITGQQETLAQPYAKLSRWGSTYSPLLLSQELESYMLGPYTQLKVKVYAERVSLYGPFRVSSSGGNQRALRVGKLPDGLEPEHSVTLFGVTSVFNGVTSVPANFDITTSGVMFLTNPGGQNASWNGCSGILAGEWYAAQ